VYLDAERAQAEPHGKKEQRILCGLLVLARQARNATRLDPLRHCCVVLNLGCALHAEDCPQKIRTRTKTRPAHVRAEHAARLTLARSLALQTAIPGRQKKIPRQILSENPPGSLYCCCFLLIAEKSQTSCSEHCFDQNFRLLLCLDELHPADHKEQHL
jgi:hypothetical protein